MGDSWSETQRLKGEAEVIAAKADLAKTKPEVLGALTEVQRVKVAGMEHRARSRVALIHAYTLKAMFHPVVLVSLTWAVAATVITWILVVKGWRG